MSGEFEPTVDVHRTDAEEYEMDEVSPEQSYDDTEYSMVGDEIDSGETSFSEQPDIQITWDKDIPPPKVRKGKITTEDTEKNLQKWKDEKAKYPMQPNLEFIGSDEGELWVRWGNEWKRLHYLSAKQFLSDATLKKDYSVDIQRAIGITEGKQSRPKLSKRGNENVAELVNASNGLDTSSGEELAEKLDDTIQSMRKRSEGANREIEQSDVGVNTDDTYTEEAYRELLAYDQIPQNFKGERLRLESQIHVLDETIENFENNLDRVSYNRDDDNVEVDIERRKHIEHEIDKAREERALKYKSLIRAEHQVKASFQQLRESWYYALDKDVPLRERIRNLFRTQGVTIGRPAGT